MLICTLYQAFFSVTNEKRYFGKGLGFNADIGQQFIQQLAAKWRGVGYGFMRQTTILAHRTHLHENVIHRIPRKNDIFGEF
jgi:hypothetical protein